MKRCFFILLLLVCVVAWPQDTIYTYSDEDGNGGITDTMTLLRFDTIYLHDTIVRHIYDTVIKVRVDTVTVRVADTAAISALREKEKFYREILSANGVDKVKLEAERNHYIHVVDSLRALVRIAEIESVRKDEANKYLEERAKVAEAQVATATNRKKKVRSIQGIAMRMYRTPEWHVRIASDDAGNAVQEIYNKRDGNIEFEFVTGASVMLWDLTKYFNRPDTNRGKLELRRFDQDFSYDVGIYVGFGGSNFFKNFYVGPSFRFVDFFYLTVGVNIAEYEVLTGGYKSGDRVPTSFSLSTYTANRWLVKPFVSMSIDLDFLSYIKM